MKKIDSEEKNIIIKVLSDIKNIKPKFKQICIAIDGFGASGKSTFANNLKELDSNIKIICLDDFYKEFAKRFKNNEIKSNINQNYDWERFTNEVLIPLKNGKKIRYQKYNWDLDQLTEWVDVLETDIIVLEGTYSLQKSFLKFLDYKIWIDTPKKMRLRRAKERDGIENLDLWVEDWIPSEENYNKKEQPKLKADLIVNGF